MYVYCSTLRKAGLWNGSCCDSCHDDVEYGYGLTGLDGDEEHGVTSEVCCAASRDILLLTDAQWDTLKKAK
jgi:hypothetical protein